MNDPKDWRPFIEGTNLCLGCSEVFTGKPKHDCNIVKPFYYYTSQEVLDELNKLAEATPPKGDTA